MTIQKFEEEIKKNWPLLIVLAFLNSLSAIPAYFLSGLASVVVNFVFIVVSTVLGYYAITRVVRITTETK